MNDHHLDSLRLLTHQQHEQRLREAAAERLARRLRRTPQARQRLLARINPNSTRATSTDERTLVKPHRYAAGASHDPDATALPAQRVLDFLRTHG